MAAYMVQAVSSKLKASGASYGGRFFAALNDSRQLDAAAAEWESRKDGDLSAYCRGRQCQRFQDNLSEDS